MSPLSLSSSALALVAASPWVLVPLAIARRARDSRSLDEEPPAPPSDAPLVSVVIPARNEARNIARCVQSVLSATYPALEVIVVDDHSDDGTGRIAREAAAGDARLQVIETPALPDGWFGKQWACSSGAAVARGSILLFADADTAHAPDLITRAVHAMRARGAGLLSVAGRQELGSFWERVIQPQIFTMLLARYGGTETVSRSPRVHDKIANGQCIFVSREAYDAIGGHGAVRDKVAEDLMLAQRMFASGRHVAVVLGAEQLSTRMYTSLDELLKGWSKNIYAGGIDAVPFGAAGRALFPIALVLPFLMTLLPPLMLVFAAMLPAAVVLWAVISTAATVVFWGYVYHAIGEPRRYALVYPLGAAVLLWIALVAIAKGRRVSWKGRSYLAR